MEVVIGRQSNDTTPAGSQRKEHLHGSLAPHGQVQKLIPLGVNVELDSSPRALESDTANEEGGEDEVGEDGGEVRHFSHGFDALEESQENNGPTDQHAAHGLPTDVAHLVNTAR